MPAPALGERARAADHAGIGQRVAAVEHQRAVVDDIAGDAAGRAAAADLQRAVADRRAAGIDVRAGEDQRARPCLGQRSRAADHTVIGQRVAAVEHQRGIVDDIAGDAPGGAAVADLQRARADRRDPGVGIVACEDERSRSGLGHRAGTADHPAISQSVAAVEAERRVGDDIARNAAGGAAVADLQRTAADRRGAGIGVVTRQRQCAGAALGQRAGAADHARIGQRVAAVEGKHAVVHDVADDRAGDAAVADLQDARADRGAAGIGAVSRQDQRAGAGLGERARAADHAGIGQRVAAVEHQSAVVDDIAGDAAGRAAAADLQRAVADRRAAGIDVRAGENKRARPCLGQPAGAGDDRTDRRAATRNHADRGTDTPECQRAARNDIATGAERQIVHGNRNAQIDRAGGAAKNGIIDCRIGPTLKADAIQPGRAGRVPRPGAAGTRKETVGVPLQGRGVRARCHRQKG